MKEVLGCLGLALLAPILLGLATQEGNDGKTFTNALIRIMLLTMIAIYAALSCHAIGLW
jgi:hypothetical protein